MTFGFYEYHTTENMPKKLRNTQRYSNRTIGYYHSDSGLTANINIPRTTNEHSFIWKLMK